MSALNPRRVLYLLTLVTFVVLLGVGIVIPILPVYAQNMGASALEIGLIFSAFSLARTLFNPIVGSIADRSEMKRLILAGIFLYAVLSLGYIVSTKPLHLILMRIFHGLASAFILPVAMSYIAMIAKEGEEGYFMGTLNMGLFFGMGAGPLIGGIMTQLFGINSAFYSLTGLSCVAFGIALFLLPEKRGHRIKGQHLSIKSIMNLPPMLGLLLFRFINSLGNSSIMAFIPILGKSSGMNSAQIGIIISANIFLTGLLQQPFGKIVSRGNMVWLIILGAVISALAYGVIPLGTTFYVYLTISIIMGLGSAISVPASSVMVIEYGRGLGMGATMGLADSAMGLGMIIGPLLSGLIMQLYGIAWVFYAGGAICLFGTGVFFILARKKV